MINRASRSCCATSRSSFAAAASSSSIGLPSAVPAAIAIRSLANVVRASRQPSFTVPTTISSGTNTPSRKTSLNNAWPVISRSGRIKIPGELMSIRKYVIPLCFGASGSVRARQTPNCALCAEDVHTFCPVSSQPPSTRTALVRSDARSEPASGSENSWHQKISPLSVAGTNRSTCSGVPCSRMVGAAHQPITRSGRSTPADDIS